MVLESLFNPFAVKKKPWEMFLAGYIYAMVGLGLAYIIFREAAGLIMVFLIVLASLPVLYTTIKNEQELDLRYDKQWKLLKEHTKVLVFLMLLFLGITLSLAVMYVMLPEPIVDSVFSLQKAAIANVNLTIQGQLTGSMTKSDLLGRIFLNNLKVLFFCIVLSFLYGTGAIFVLTWNASVIAAAMGNLFKSELGRVTTELGAATATSYVGAAAVSFFRYMTHGFLEIAAYFVAGLAGGIISIAIVKRNLKEDKVLIDTLDLILISLGLLLIAGIVEVYVTPLFFPVG